MGCGRRNLGRNGRLAMPPYKHSSAIGLRRYRPPHDTGILPEMQLSLKSRPTNSDLPTVMRADIKQRGKIAAKGCAQIPLCTMYAVACTVECGHSQRVPGTELDIAK